MDIYNAVYYHDNDFFEYWYYIQQYIRIFLRLPKKLVFRHKGL